MSAKQDELRRKVIAAFPNTLTQDVVMAFYDRTRFPNGQRSLSGIAKEVKSDRASVAVCLAPLYDEGLFSRKLTGAVGGEKVLYYILEGAMHERLNPPANVRFARVPYLPTDIQVPSDANGQHPLSITGALCVDANLDPIVRRRFHPIIGYTVIMAVDILVTCSTLPGATTYRVAHSLKVRFNNTAEHNILSTEILHPDGSEDNPIVTTAEWATAVEDYLITRALAFIVDGAEAVSRIFDFAPTPSADMGDDGDDGDDNAEDNQGLDAGALEDQEGRRAVLAPTPDSGKTDDDDDHGN